MLSKTQPYKNKLICHKSSNLTSLYQLCHQVRFSNYFIANENSSTHFNNSPANRIHQLQFHYHRVSRYNLRLKFTIINL